MQQDFEEIMKAKKEELEKAKLEPDKTKSEVGFSGEGKQDINIKDSENTSLGLQVSAERTGLDLSKVFRKEFKIQGQVGLENQKDKIGFISLIRQVEAGVSKDIQMLRSWTASFVVSARQYNSEGIWKHCNNVPCPN